MMRTKIVQSLLVASLATLGANAFAQYAAPPEPTPGQPQPITGTTSNGSSVVVTPPSTMTAPSPAPYTAPGMTSQYNSQFNTNDNQVRAYQSARQACAALPLAQQTACNADADSRSSAIDPKCEKLSGEALADCLHGADHGG